MKSRSSVDSKPIERPAWRQGCIPRMLRWLRGIFLIGIKGPLLREKLGTGLEQRKRDHAPMSRVFMQLYVSLWNTNNLFFAGIN